MRNTDNGFPEIFQKKAEGTGCVAHCVGAMENNKRIEVGVVELDFRAYPHPI